MNHASRSVRTPHQFTAKLHKNLNDYALNAAAAGVALLAIHPSAAAEIVFTPADQQIGNNARLDLDLNNDGVIDFRLINDLHLSTTPFGDDLSIKPAYAANGFVRAPSKPYSYFAAALPAGVRVGPGVPFLNRNANMAFASLTAINYVSGGPWKNAYNRFLGVKFLINGEVHYGWVRLNVLANKNTEEVRATLTGYAYETVANRPIIAGQTSGQSADRTPGTEVGNAYGSGALRPDSGGRAVATLGLLARGAEGISLWRREEPAGSTGTSGRA